MHGAGGTVYVEGPAGGGGGGGGAGGERLIRKGYAEDDRGEERGATPEGKDRFLSSLNGSKTYR